MPKRRQRGYYELMNRRETKREAQSNRGELLERMKRLIPVDGAIEALDGIFLARLSRPIESTSALYQPAFCFVAQGGKQVLLGEAVRRAAAARHR